MNKSHQLMAAWSGYVAMAMLLGALVVMQFFPPLAPSLTPMQVAHIYQAYAFQIRLGALFMVISAMFAGPFDAVLFLQLRRMEGLARPVAAYGQLASGIANIQFFILPGVCFAIAAYRPDRPIDILYALNDIAWITTMFPWTVGAMQCVCVGLAILKHGSESGAFPRWLGFFNMWIALLMATSSFIPFFQVGPFAWNGLIGFWIPATVFGIWMGVMAWMLVAAIGKDA